MDAPSDVLLPGLPDPEGILDRYRHAAGNELDRKFMSPESSSALVANVFGFFRKERAALLPEWPGGAGWGWPASHLEIEVEVRFPWRGGRHPWLDAVVETPTHLIGIESKRYEPFRGEKDPEFSEAFDRDVWGDRMARYTKERQSLRNGEIAYRHLDAAQLVKHAYALRTAAHKKKAGKQPVLFYLYDEPQRFIHSNRAITSEEQARHREEIVRFAGAVAGDEVPFAACSYPELLAAWGAAADADVRRHAEAVAAWTESRERKAS